MEDPKASQKVCGHSLSMHQRPRDPTASILVGYSLQRVAVTGEQIIFFYHLQFLACRDSVAYCHGSSASTHS